MFFCSWIKHVKSTTLKLPIDKSKWMVRGLSVGIQEASRTRAPLRAGTSDSAVPARKGMSKW